MTQPTGTEPVYAESLAQLESLYIFDSHFRLAMINTTMLQGSKLDELTIHVQESLEPMGIAAPSLLFDKFRPDVTSSTKDLRYFHVRSSCIKDSDSADFIVCFPNIETLILEDAGVTGAFFVDLFAAPTCRLRRIVLKDCFTVSSDIVRWAATRGVRVDVKRPIERSLGGRMVGGGRRAND
jgi:hypothetical protein